MDMKEAAFLPIITLICGIFLLGIGIKETAEFPSDYVETIGYYEGSTIAEEAHYDSQKQESVATTYYLTYQFTVDNEIYYVTTNYSTSIVPSLGEEITILYDAENPENAVIGGPSNDNTFLILFGLFFILGSLPFLLIIFGNDMKSLKFDKMGVLMGSIVAIVGYGGLAIICGSFSPVGIFNYIDSSFVLPMIIPFLMIFAGIFAVIKGTIFYKPQD